MPLSDDKINELSHMITQALEEDSRVTLNRPANSVRLAVRRSLGKAMQKDTQAIRLAEEKISSQRRSIPEGSDEWEALYWQYYEEEIGKLRSIR